MKPFKLVWIETSTLEYELENLREIDDIDGLISRVEPNIQNKVCGGYRLFKWNGSEYEPYNQGFKR